MGFSIFNFKYRSKITNLFNKMHLLSLKFFKRVSLIKKIVPFKFKIHVIFVNIIIVTNSRY